MSSLNNNSDTSNTTKTPAATPFTGEGIFPKGEKNEAYARYFTGTSYLNMLSMEGVVIGNVTVAITGRRTIGKSPGTDFQPSISVSWRSGLT